MSSDVSLSPRRHWRWDLSAARAGHKHRSTTRQRSWLLSCCTRLLADAVILNTALALAFLLHYLWELVAESDPPEGVRPQELAHHYFQMYLGLFWILTLIGLVTFWLGGLYTYVRSHRIRYKAMLAAQAVAFAFGLTILAVYLTGKMPGLPGAVLLTAGAIAVVLVVTARVWSALWRHLLSDENARGDATPSGRLETVRDASWWSEIPASGRLEPATEARQRSDAGTSGSTRDTTPRSDTAVPMHVGAARDASGWPDAPAPAQVEPADASQAARIARVELTVDETQAARTARVGRVKAEGCDKTVLVIGGAGYIGSALLPRILRQGYRVRVLDLFLYGFGPIAEVLHNPAVEIIRADFRQIDALVRAMQGVDHVVHLGGIVGDPACAIDEELTIDVNVAATRLVSEVAKGQGIKHFIFASTCSMYGASDNVLSEKSPLNPLSLYARSKMASEWVLLGMADDTFTPTILRFGTIYGRSGRTRFDLVVNVLAAKAAFERRITVFGGDQWRPFLHVDDAALAIVELLNLPPGRGADVFNVGSNQENYTIGQVGALVKRIVPEAELIVAPDDRDQRNYRVSFSKIQIMVEFEPHWTVELGVRQIVDAIRAGEITDYREMRYSNEKYLTEMNGNGLAPPQMQWAHDLIRRAPAVPVGAVH